MDELGPHGWNLTLTGVNTLYCLEEWRCEQRIAPPGGDFTPGDKINPLGTTSPSCQSLPLGVKLRMGLWPQKIVLLKVRHEVFVVAEGAEDDESQDRQDTWKRSQGVKGLCRATPIRSNPILIILILS
jgi:hypothetical protein